jgi:GntR family transcriptional regulator of vanillate catabolism
VCRPEAGGSFDVWQEGTMVHRSSPMVSRSEAVIIELRNKILAGEFSAGFHLQEVALAEALGVSRTPIREALATLAKEGLLAPGPKRGYKVRTFTIDEVVSAYEVRATLEGLAVRLLAERGVGRDVEAELRSCLELGDRMLARRLSESDQAAWLEMNNTFHTTIVRATGNAMLADFVNQSHQVPLASSRHVHWYRFDEENFSLARRAHEAHHDIVEAIAQRASARGEALMREHIYFSQRLIQQHFQERLVGFDASPKAGNAAETTSGQAAKANPVNGRR